MSNAVFAYEFKSLPEHLRPDNNGPLYMQRLVVKDVVHIEGVPTGAGNPDWLATQQTPEQTSPIILKLIAAGAELVAKTQTDELAYSSYGHNMHYGIPINPMAPDCLPGGSSSGSAVAVASGLAEIGIGTDTVGAVRIPASFCGLFGFRPTHSLVSMQHVLPLSPSFDTMGWMTRDFETFNTVSDIILTASSTQAETILDKTSRPKRALLLRPGNCTDDQWQQFLQPIKSSLFNVFDTVDEKVLSTDWLSELYLHFQVLQGREAWQAYGSWFEQTQPLVAKDLAQRFTYCQNLTESDETSAKACIEEFKRYLNDLVPDDSWCAILPTTPSHAPAVLDAATSDFDPDLYESYDLKQFRDEMASLCVPASLMGWPQISLPLTYDNAAPWGISILGRAYQDFALLNSAQALLEEVGDIKVKE